jgi:O-antigen/teichoic acid export membrane protein
MTITQPGKGTNPSENRVNICCPQCNTLQPSYALFCGFCGERIKQKSDEAGRLRNLIRHPWLLAFALIRRVQQYSLLRNSIYIIGTGAATSVFGYFFWILATHIYSPYDVGLGSALISAMTLASIIANLGMGSTLVQTLPRRAAGYAWSLTLNAGIATGVVAGLLCGVITVVALPLFSQQFSIVQTHIGYAIAIVAGVPLLTVSALLDQAFIAERAAHNMLIRNAAVAVLKIPLLVLPLVLVSGVSALGILASGVVAIAVVLIGVFLLLIPRLRRNYCLAVRGIGGQIRSMLSLLTGNYFITLGGLSTSYLLPVVVAILLSPADNAYFYTTSRVGEFILVGSAAVSSSLFAEGSHAADDLSRKVLSSARIIAMLLFPGMLICFFGGYYILSIFGSGYAQHGLTLLRIDTFSAVPDAITNIYVSVLRVQKRMRLAAGLNVGMAALTFILSWILLPVMGIAGQGLAYLIAASAGSLVAGVDAFRLRSRHKAGTESPFL